MYFIFLYNKDYISYNGHNLLTYLMFFMLNKKNYVKNYLIYLNNKAFFDVFVLSMHMILSFEFVTPTNAIKL